MRSSAVVLASFVALGALLPLACTQDFGVFSAGSATSSSGAGGSGGSVASSTTGDASSTSSTSGGTGGAAPECMAGDACSDMNPCTQDSCDTAAGKCIHPAIPDGPSADGMNTPKDCQTPACIGGKLGQIADNTDLPDDGNPCTSDTCDNGTPKHSNLGPTEKCGAGLVCDGNGACVGCVDASQCTGAGTCQSNACEGGMCKVNDTPAGQACNGNKVCDGGGNCVGCLDDTTCFGNKICINKNCATSCNTGVKDGKETDVDCGGQCQTKCAVGKMCNVVGDCVAGLLCTGNVCTAPSSCTDSLKNGAETDVDCGGGTCPVCANTKACGGNNDCLSLSCVGNVCVPTQCSDGTKNGSETAVDCGGSCTKCPLTKACAQDSDCQSNNCMANICAP